MWPNLRLYSSPSQTFLKLLYLLLLQQQEASFLITEMIRFLIRSFPHKGIKFNRVHITDPSLKCLQVLC